MATRGLLTVFAAAAVDGLLRRLTVLEGAFAASLVVDERRFFTDEAPVCPACLLSPANWPMFLGATRAEVSIGECCANAEHLSTVMGEKRVPMAARQNRCRLRGTVQIPSSTGVTIPVFRS